MSKKKLANSDFVRTAQQMLDYLEPEARDTDKVMMLIAYDPDTSEFLSAAIGKRNNISRALFTAIEEDKELRDIITLTLNLIDKSIKTREIKRDEE